MCVYMCVCVCKPASFHLQVPYDLLWSAIILARISGRSASRCRHEKTFIRTHRSSKHVLSDRPEESNLVLIFRPWRHNIVPI